MNSVGVFNTTMNLTEVGWFTDATIGGISGKFRPFAVWVFGGVYHEQDGALMTNNTTRYYVRWYPSPQPGEPAYWQFEAVNYFVWTTPAASWNEGDVLTNAERDSDASTWSATYPPDFSALQSLGPTSWSNWPSIVCYYDNDYVYQNYLYQSPVRTQVKAGASSCV